MATCRITIVDFTIITPFSRRSLRLQRVLDAAREPGVPAEARALPRLVVAHPAVGALARLRRALAIDHKQPAISGCGYLPGLGEEDATFDASEGCHAGPVCSTRRRARAVVVVRRRAVLRAHVPLDAGDRRRDIRTVFQ